MVCYSKVNTFLLVDKESTFNTPVSTTKDVGIIGDYTVDLNNNPFEVPAGIGSREKSSVEAGNFEGTVNLNGSLNSGALLEMYFGQCTDTATTGDYKHTFINDDGSETLPNTVPSYTIQENHDSTADLTLTHGGCSLNSLEVSLELNAEVKYSAEIWTASASTGSSVGTKVSTTTKPLIYSQFSLSVGDEGSESAVSGVQSFSLSMAQGLERTASGLGSQATGCYAVGDFVPTGDFTVVFSSNTELDRFLDTATKSGLIFSGNNGVTLGSGRKELYVRLWGVLLTTVNKTVGETGAIEVTFNYQADTIKDLYMVDQVASYF